MTQNQNPQEGGQALAPIDVRGTKIEVYGQRAEVRELMSRLMSLHPAAAQVGQAGMLAVAQLAIMAGANPLPATNEIHIWQDSGKTFVQLGINYYRRRAQEQGGLFWVEKPRPMSEQEREGLDIAKGTLAAICKGVRMSHLLQLSSPPLRLDLDAIFEAVGAVGMGIAMPNEQTKKGRPAIWTALLRCERDLLRQLFPHFYQGQEASPAPRAWDRIYQGPAGGLAVEVPEHIRDQGQAAAYMEMHQRAEATRQQIESLTPEQLAERAARNAELLYGPDGFEGFDGNGLIVIAPDDWGQEPPGSQEDEQQGEQPPGLTPPEQMVVEANEALEMVYYRNPYHLRGAVRKALDTPGWYIPSPTDTEAWQEGVGAAVAYATVKIAEAKQTEDEPGDEPEDEGGGEEAPTQMALIEEGEPKEACKQCGACWGESLGKCPHCGSTEVVAVP